MAQKRVLVISSANIDFVQQMHRVPYSGESISEPDRGYEYLPGGKGANSAVAFARMGADCVFLCRVGTDPSASALLSKLRSERIDVRYIKEDETLPTGLASVLAEDNGKSRIIVYPGANSALCEEDVEESFNCYPDAVFLQFEIPDRAVLEAARRANEANIPLFVDAGPARIDYPLAELGRVEIFSPNESETKLYTGITPLSEESCLRAAIKLRSRVDAKYIVIKLGERGSFIFDGREYFVVPAEPVEAVDTSASGDIFSAVMTHVYLENGNILSAVKYATCAAAISVTRHGAASSAPVLEEVLSFVKKKLSSEDSTPANGRIDDYAVASADMANIDIDADDSDENFENEDDEELNIW